MIHNTKKSFIFRLILFFAMTVIISWAGVFATINNSTENTKNLGMTVWLLTPFFVSLLLRLFTRDWKDFGIRFRFKYAGKGYLYSLLIYPAIIVIILLLGGLTKAVSFQNFNVHLFLETLAVSAAPTLIKNIAEEFSWRGYMTPKIHAVTGNAATGDLITGLLWGLWHIPYYLFLIDRAELKAYTALSMPVFLPMVILGITVSGALFGRIRTSTGSVWPCVLMHTVSNILTVTLLTGEYIQVNSNTEMLFTPGWHGLLSIILTALAAYLSYRLLKEGENTYPGLKLRQIPY